MPERSSMITFVMTLILISPFIPILGQGDGAGSNTIDLTDLDSYVKLGREDSLTIFNSEDGPSFGDALAAGDLDGDGMDDIAVGYPESKRYNGAGVVMVFFSRDPDELSPLYGHLDCDLMIYGSNKDDKFGSSLLFHDMNNDGRDELIIGAPYGDGQAGDIRDSGEVLILEGRERSQFKTLFEINMVPLFGRIYGRDAGDHLGLDMVAADLTGDSVSDLVIRNTGGGGFASSESINQNECFGSWELEIIEGDEQGIGAVDIRRSGSYLRFFGQYNVTPDVYATHIGNGLAVGDINGDGNSDLIFSYQYEETGYVAVIEGGSEFPYNNGGPITVHTDTLFRPMISINLDETGFEEAKLACGKLDNDDMDDLVVGLPYAPARESFRRLAGQIDVYYGREKRSIGEGMGWINIDRSDANLTIWGMDSSDRMGSGLMIVDPDGDGINEIFATAPWADGIDNMEFDIGESYLFQFDVNTTELNITDAVEIYIGGQENSGAFTSFAKMQFFDDDAEELIVSSPDHLSQKAGVELRGMVSLLSQRSAFDGFLIGQFDSSLFGYSTLMEDFNNDGFFDIAVGDPIGADGRKGNVDLFFGDEGGWSGRTLASKSADHSYHDSEDNADLGHVIATGDLDNDGYPDLAIGAPIAGFGLLNDPGQIDIYWGGPKSRMASEGHTTIRGYNVERVGSGIVIDDLNNDGYDDIAYSSPYDHGPMSKDRYHAGVVYIIFGPISNSTGSISSRNGHDVRIIGSLKAELIGQELDSSDINGDGKPELIIGAPSSSRGSVEAQGLVYVMEGRDTWPGVIDLLTDDCLKVFGPWPFDKAGSKLGSGDMDGDGMDELVIGSMIGDGFQRSTPEAGNVYIMDGAFLTSRMPNGTFMLRTESNITISGDEDKMMTGSSVSMGDINNDGIPDLFIGASGWRDPYSDFETGAVFIFLADLYKDHLQLNTSSLPIISGFSDQDRAGSSIYTRDITGDGMTDLLIGATGADPLQKGNDPGAVYYWEGKSMFYSPLKASTLSVDGPGSIAGDLGTVTTVIEPLEGPISMTLSARAEGGFDMIRSIEVEMKNSSLPGSAVVRLDVQEGNVSIDTTGAYKDKIIVFENDSSMENDNLQTWFAEIAFDIEYEMPDSDILLTRVSTDTDTYTNYLSDNFVIDRTVDLDISEMEITSDSQDPENAGWLNSTSSFSLDTIELTHGITGNPITDNSSQGMVFKIYRPDGIPIGTADINDSRLKFIDIAAGDGLGAANTPFVISPMELPAGALWEGNVTVELNVDTYSPPPVSSFTIYPDGKEISSRAYDDDELVELFWTPVKDQGGSGIAIYQLTVIDESGGKEMYTDLEPGDLLLIPRGNVTLSLLAIDHAGNKGQETNFTITVDVTDPIFSDAFPGDNSWINEDSNSFSIKVMDQGSGIDPGSAQYRVYRSDVNLLSDWMRVREIKNELDSTWTLNATVPSSDGYGNYIQWRVSDNVGITSLSEPMSYNMDTERPSIDIEEKELYMGPVEFTLEAYMEDSLSGLELSSISYRIASQDEFYGRGWTSLGINGKGASSLSQVMVLPAFRGRGFAQWMVTDNAGNHVESDLVSIFIDDVYPEFTDFQPNGTSFLKVSSLSVSIGVKEEESGIGPGDVEYSISTPSGWIDYGVGGYSPWMKVTDLVDNGFGTYTASVDVKIDEGPLNRIRFRARDIAGNGWVVSSILTLKREAQVKDLPPIAQFTVIPAVDVINSGDELILDGSPSFDPEGKNLTYSWYSDLEGFPETERLASGVSVNISLQKVGVHSVWLEVSDGNTRVSSEEVKIRVVAKESPEEEDDGSERGILNVAGDALILLIIALLIGILIGGLIASRILGSGEQENAPVPDSGPWVEAKYEPDYSVPYCTHCDAEVRLSDEYCMTCGQVFSPEDKKKMEKNMKKGKKRKKKKALPPRYDDDIPEEETITDEMIDSQEFDEDNPFTEDSIEQSEPPTEDDIIDEIQDVEEYDEIEDIEDYEEIEDMEEIDEMDLEEEWEVDE